MCLALALNPSLSSLNSLSDSLLLIPFEHFACTKLFQIIFYNIEYFRMWESVKNVRKCRNGSLYSIRVTVAESLHFWKIEKKKCNTNSNVGYTRARAADDVNSTTKQKTDYNIKFSPCKKQMVLHSIDFSFIHLLSAFGCHGLGADGRCRRSSSATADCWTVIRTCQMCPYAPNERARRKQKMNFTIEAIGMTSGDTSSHAAPDQRIHSHRNDSVDSELRLKNVFAHVVTHC